MTDSLPHDSQAVGLKVGEVCLCSGLVDQVTICQDGVKLDTVSAVSCTPDPVGCGPASEPDPEQENDAVCGNGILESGEACDSSSIGCPDDGYECTAYCTCQDDG